MNGYSWFFGLLGAVLALLVMAVCLFGRDMEPVLLLEAPGITECAQGFLSGLSAGDFAGASAYLLGQPGLDGGQEPDSEVSSLIWEAFAHSLSYELVGSPYASAAGAAQDVVITSLQIPDITAGIRQHAGEKMTEEIAAAENMAEVYREDLSYREDFVAAVLRETAAEAIAHSEPSSRRLTLTLICPDGVWRVVPDPALMHVLSGGIYGT